MFTIRALPRWQLRNGVNTARAFRRQFSAQQNLRSLQSEQLAAKHSDPVEALRARAKNPDVNKPHPTSFTWRIIRGVCYITVFSATGFFASWAWKTYLYLKMGQVMPLPATRHTVKEMFSAEIDRSSLVESLIRDGWVEDNPKERKSDGARGVTQGQHMVNEVLVGNGHLVTKHFRHPTEAMTVLVFMADFSCESWPQTLHGGIATTVIQEALNTHLNNFPDYESVEDQRTTMNYRLPLQPGLVYSVLIRTDERQYPLQAQIGDTDQSSIFMGVACDVLVNAMDRAPRYIERYDEVTKMTERICDIHDVRKDVKAYVKGGSMLFLVRKDYRELLQRDRTVIPIFKKMKDTWVETCDSAKAKPSK